MRYASLEFNTKWLTFAESTETKLIKLLTKVGWAFVRAQGLDTCVGRLFQYTLNPEVKARAWEHLRKYVTTQHFKGNNRIGLSLPATAIQFFKGKTDTKKNGSDGTRGSVTCSLPGRHC